MNRQCFQQAVLLCLLKELYYEYASMLHVSYAQNCAGKDLKLRENFNVLNIEA